MEIRNMLSFANISIKQVPREYNTKNLIHFLLFIEYLILTFIVLSFYTVKSTNTFVGILNVTSIRAKIHISATLFLSLG